MKNLATKNTSDFTITENGEAFISQRKTADLLGIPRTTLQDWISKFSATLNLSDINQLSPKSFQKAAMFGQSRNSDLANIVVEKLMEAGATAYIYNEAGYEMTALKPTQINQAIVGGFTDVMGGLEISARMLNLSESSKLGLVTQTHEQFGITTNALPHYAIDAPVTSTIGSSEVTASATTLLNDRDKPMSARKFNKIMISAGYLVELERPSSNGDTKKFKSLTEDGLKFGKNITSPTNPRETQPHYYRESFDELLNWIAPIDLE